MDFLLVIGGHHASEGVAGCGELRDGSGSGNGAVAHVRELDSEPGGQHPAVGTAKSDHGAVECTIF